jgi:hypothetical protein
MSGAWGNNSGSPSRGRTRGSEHSPIRDIHTYPEQGYASYEAAGYGAYHAPLDQSPGQRYVRAESEEREGRFMEYQDGQNAYTSPQTALYGGIPAKDVRRSIRDMGASVAPEKAQGALDYWK